MKRPPYLHWARRTLERIADIAVTLLVHLGALGFPEDRPRHDRKGRR